MLANQIQHYLKYRHITHSGCTGTCTPHQLCTHAPSAVDAPHISSPSTPCSTSPLSNTRMPHQHHTHSPSAPHTHIHLHTPNNLTVSSLHWDLGSTNITCNYIFVTFEVSFFFFLTFDGSIITLNSTNITYDNTFATFGCTHIFF